MRRKSSLLLAVVIGLSLHPLVGWALDPAFVIVASPGTTDRRLTREAAARIFLRKQNFWESGARTQPVNLPVTHPLRREFSQSILGMPPDALQDYWRDMYFQGVLPPHVLASEEAVALFVASTPGAVGYVSTCAAAQKLSIVLVVGDIGDCPR